MPQGRKPKDPAQKRNRMPMVHPWQPAEGEGWQFGEKPEPPDGLMQPTRDAWDLWFDSWWASFWKPADLPQIRLVAQMFDKGGRNELGASKLLPWLDRLGITPKGRQDLRWLAPTAAKADTKTVAERRSALKVV